MSDIYNIFEFAGGSVTGRDHLYIGTGRRKVLVSKNNQDTRIVFFAPDYLIALVLDGCSDGVHSEVGAKEAAALFIQAFRKYLRYHAPDADMYERVRRDVLAEIRVRANGMGSSLSQIIGNYYLFTVVGVYLDRSDTVIFSQGDGVYVINGEATTLGPFPDNAPPYMAYDIIASSQEREQPVSVLGGFHARSHWPTADVESLLIGTDGVSQLIDSADRTIPGREELIGPISQFWENDRYYTNPYALQHRLHLINRDYVDIDWEAQNIKDERGRLSDDTTLVVIRRRKT